MAEAVQETHVPPRAYKKEEMEKKEESGRASASA